MCLLCSGQEPVLRPDARGRREQERVRLAAAELQRGAVEAFQQRHPAHLQGRTAGCSPQATRTSSSLPLSGFQNLQAMDERRTVKLGETYQSFAEAERRVIPIISKCLEGMIVAAKAVDERRVGDQRRPGAGLVPPDCPSISCFMSSRPPRTRPSWWSRSNPALTLRGTTPSKTSARIWAGPVLTPPLATRLKGTGRRMAERDHGQTPNTTRAEPRTNCGCLARNQRYEEQGIMGKKAQWLKKKRF